MYGGYIRYDGGAISLRSLASLVEPFGVSADALRVVMSRLRREGWLDVNRTAGRAEYRATDDMWHLLDEGYERIFHPAEAPGRGEWYVVMYEVPEAERKLRDQLRRQLAWLGFAPLMTSTWLSCHDRLDAVRAWAADYPQVRLETLVARSRGDKDDWRFVAQCWDLDSISAAYYAFIEQYGSSANRHAWEQAKGIEALVMRVRLSHEYRLFTFQDPRLPRHLLPEQWPAPVAEKLFAEAYNHLEAEANAAYSTLTARSAPLPARLRENEGKRIH